MLTAQQHIQKLKKLSSNENIPSGIRQALLNEIADLEQVINKPIVDYPLPEFKKRASKPKDVMDKFAVDKFNEYKSKQSKRQQR